jgi:integrase
LAFIGLREGEILGLSWQEVDLDGGAAMVLYELPGSGEKATRHQLKTKASEATVPLPPFVVERLRAHRDSLGAEPPEVWSDDGLVFVAPRGYAVNGSG